MPVSVSVIIPTYNRAQLVQETIDSVLNQTYRDYEIIVIDDGSTDNTEEALLKYRDKIKYIKQENRGLNAARNTAIKLAQGKYIALLDSDDLWLEFKLELETAILDQYSECGFVFSDFYILKPGNKRIPHGLHTWFMEPPKWDSIFQSSAQFTPDKSSTELQHSDIVLYFGDIYYISLFGPRVLPSASLYRKSMTENFLVFNENDTACGDWEFFSKLSHRHNPVYIDIETALNRSHEDAVRLTRIDHKIQLRQRIELVERTWKADVNFYNKYQKEVNNELIRVYMDLLKYQLFDGFPKQARESIRAIENIEGDFHSNKLKLYKLLAHIPGTSSMIKRLKKLR